MARCSANRWPKRKYCAGDLDRQITIHQRSLTAGLQLGGDFAVNNTVPVVYWARIRTLWEAAGMAAPRMFDGVAMQDAPTHEFVVRYTPNVDISSTIEHAGVFYRVMEVTDVDERHEWTVIGASSLGKTTATAAKF